MKYPGKHVRASQNKDIFEFAALKEYVLSLTSTPPYNYAVPPELQQKEIDSLKETLGSKRFFFVTNLETFSIVHPHGVERWLGYSEKDFTTKKYLDSVVHPGPRKSMILVALKLYNALCSGKYALNFMVQRYGSMVALKHYKGHYLLATKTSSVFQYDKNNRLTAYLNEFTITGEYHGEPMSPHFYTSKGEEETRGNEILEETLELFLKMKVFSPNELQVARKLAYNPDMKQSEVAKSMEISMDDLHQYYNRILNKSRGFFHENFTSTLNAAIYLKREGLL